MRMLHSKLLFLMREIEVDRNSEQENQVTPNRVWATPEQMTSIEYQEIDDAVPMDFSINIDSCLNEDGSIDEEKLEDCFNEARNFAVHQIEWFVEEVKSRVRNS